jgi:hypothetical protein
MKTLPYVTTQDRLNRCTVITIDIQRMSSLQVMSEYSRIFGALAWKGLRTTIELDWDKHQFVMKLEESERRDILTRIRRVYGCDTITRQPQATTEAGS